MAGLNTLVEAPVVVVVVFALLVVVVLYVTFVCLARRCLFIKLNNAAGIQKLSVRKGFIRIPQRTHQYNNTYSHTHIDTHAHTYRHAHTHIDTHTHSHTQTPTAAHREEGYILHKQHCYSPAGAAGCSQMQCELCNPSRFARTSTQ